ncbi:VTT domain-containing protein [Rossellomorea sp. RS05]|uniref:TVP38/TMEM64 family protein n=1 Tax=Rossellomorea sp. RS05 TaxID=3149166 RepID=UPI0032221274
MNWQQQTIDLFIAYESIAVVISIALNIVISVLGVVPSVFLTAANLAVFGLWGGIGVSFIGEVFGAIIAFFLYRKGFRQLKDWKGFTHPKVQKLLGASGKESFILILSLRIMPFIPSGLVTFIAAIGKTPWTVFVAASSLGKIDFNRGILGISCHSMDRNKEMDPCRPCRNLPLHHHPKALFTAI